MDFMKKKFLGKKQEWKEEKEEESKTEFQAQMPRNWKKKKKKGSDEPI